MNAAEPLGAVDLALVALLILLHAGASTYLQLGLGKRLLVAALRSVVQLTLLGMWLSWLFEREGAAPIVVWMLVMATVAGVEAVRRTTRRVKGLFPMTTAVMLVSSMAVTLYGLLAVVGVEPWWSPRYAIPILGMVLGNTLNGIALGLETLLAGFDERRDEVELLLAAGATRAEAARPVVRDAVRTGMIPILNSMVAVGVVSIPGMMTGQILGGEDPAAAARYQIFILFLIAGGVALGTLGVVLAGTRLLFDDRDRLRSERLTRVG